MGFPLKCVFTSMSIIFLFSIQIEAEILEKTEHSFNNGSRSIIGRELLGTGSCNIFRGKWVYDASYPLYDYSKCPFIDNGFNCQKYNRPDKLYLKYRWQPFSCSLPRFNGLNLLEKWRGKKIMFVGDSLSVNMWESLGCMIHSWVPNSRFSFITNDGIAEIVFLDYDFRMLLYRTPYLVDMVKENVGTVLKLDSIEGGNAWLGMDMLIFNSWHWWTHTGNSQPWNYMEEGGRVQKDMNRLVAYYKGLTTWARWVNRNIDPSKTKVVFQGISPTHYMGKEWGEPTQSCARQTQPFFGARYPGGIPLASIVVNKVLNRIKKPVYLLDITSLSQYRKDAHPNHYSFRSGLDCSHWCLPGLPDTWNELLYAAIFT